MVDPLVSVVVLTYNGEDYLDALLSRVEEQLLDGAVEVIVIDSGSTDASLAIIARHDVRLIEIRNDEFGHGRTRALAARIASGRYIAYLTQDAVPDSAYWLAELLAPFAISDRVALVTGRQRPRVRAFPLQKYEILGVFSGLGPATGTTLYGAGARAFHESELGHAAFHSDVNAAVRRELVTGPLPFRDVPYAEDQLMGRDVLEGGWLKAYAGRACVEHSNDLTLSEYGPRIFDETVALRRIGAPIAPLGHRQRLVLTFRGVLGDTLRILRDPEFSAGQKLYWLVTNPAYHVAKWRHYRRATRIDMSDVAAVAAGSLEHRRKRSSDASKG